MPGTVLAPTSVGVFPFSLSTKFASSSRFEGRTTEYHDGTIERAAQVGSSRRTWRASKRLSSAEMNTLRNWFDNHQADAFWFYDLRETSPVNSWDPSGVAIAGRYLVRFNSDWRESIGIGRSDVEVELIEISQNSGGDVDTGGGGGVTSPGIIVATLNVTTEYIPGTYDAFERCTINDAANSYFTQINVIFSSVAHGPATTSIDLTSGLAIGRLAGLLSGTQYVYFFMEASLIGSSDPYDQLLVSDCSINITFADLTTAVLRPNAASAHAPSGGSGYGSVSFALDGSRRATGDIRSIIARSNDSYGRVSNFSV